MSRDKPNDQRFLETMQVRVRAPNPPIERREREESPTTTLARPDLPAAEPQVSEPLEDDGSEGGSSIYDRLEQTDRSEELLAAQAELESALEAFGSGEAPPGAIPQSAPALEDTKTFLGASDVPTRPGREAEEGGAEGRARPAPEVDVAPDPTAPTARPTPKDRAPTRPSDERPAAPRPAPRAGVRADRAATEIVSAAAPLDPAPRRRPDPTTRGRAEVRARPTRLETEPTPTDPDAGPRAAALLDDDETVLASEPPRAGRHRAEDGAAAYRLVRRARAPAAAPEAPPAPTARPMDRLAHLGTHAAPDALKEQALQNLQASLPAARASALKPLRGELDAATLATLDRLLDGGFEADGGEAGASPKRALERLLADKYFQQLTAKEQAVLLRPLAAAPDDVASIKAGLALLKSGTPRRLKAVERGQILGVFASIDPEARVRLAQLAARRLRGRSALEDRDLQDQGLAGHLDALIHGRGFDARLEARGLSREQAVALLLATVAHPERLSFEEGSAGVLGTFEFALAESAPAELARLWRNLSFDGLAAPLAGGPVLDLAARLAREPALRFKGPYTPLRAAFEGLADLARPSGRTRQPTFIMPGGHGIDADVVSRALERVYGFGFTVAAGAANAMRHLERVSAEPQRLPPVFVTLLYARGERLFLFDHLDADWVYLRAPRGRSAKQRGALRVDPNREVVDADRGLDRLPLDGFEERVGVGLIPRL